MNSARERLKALFGEIGINTEEGYSAGELEAYAKGIELALGYVDEVLRRSLAITDDETDLADFVELMGYYCKNDNGLVEYRLSSSFGELSEEELSRAMRAVGESLSFSIENGVSVFSGVDGCSLKGFCDFVRGYASFAFPAKAGSSSSFDAWDNLGKMWFELDELKARFDILDSLEVDKINE